MSILKKDLLKIKAIKEKNTFLYSTEARDGKINIYKDKESKVIFIKSNIKKNYYRDKLFKKDISFLKELNLKKPKIIDNQDSKRRFQAIKKSKNFNLLDIGTGNGEFLKISKNYFNQVSGVEPNKYQFSLLSNYFKMYQKIESIKETYSVITLFHVLEHVEDQINFLRKIKDRLKKNGTLYIEVPHAEDAMLQHKAYRKFVLWSEHRVLHTKFSIKKLLSYLGFKKFSIDYIQRYDANNHLGWIFDSLPGGHEKFKIVKSSLNKYYKNKLSRSSISDTLFIKIQNS